MSCKAVQPEGVSQPQAPYSPVVVGADLVFVAGQVAFDESGEIVAGDAAAQARQVMQNMQACLGAVGCDLTDVLKVTAYLADFGDFATFNNVYREFFTEPYPARTTIAVSLAGGILVEVDAIARARV